jgi:hypothetical protein
MDGVSLLKFYVYGPTAAEYMACRRIGFYDANLEATLLTVQDVKATFEERRYQGASIGVQEAPTRYYFNPELSREPISGGASAHAVNAQHGGRGTQGGGEGVVDWNGPSDGDGGAK